MPTPKAPKKQAKTIVDDTREVAEVFLHTLQMQRIIPKTFSGVLTPRFGNQIMVWQFEKNKIVGAIVVNVKNANIFSKKILEAPNSVDWSEAVGEVESGDESSTV